MPGAFNRVIARLKEEPLLRVGKLCIFWKHPKEWRVECVDIGQEAAPFAAGLALAFVRTEIRCVIPAVSRDLGDAVATSAQVIPELIQCVGARIAPCHAYNCNVRRIFERPSGSLSRLAVICAIQMLGQTAKRAVLKEERLWQFTEMRLKLLGQVNHHDRVQPVAFEQRFGVDALGRQLQQRCDFSPQNIDHVCATGTWR